MNKRKLFSILAALLLVAVKQLVLVPEQIEFRYRCRELIYNILAENGFTIPFPQRDVHMIDDNK